LPERGSFKKEVLVNPVFRQRADIAPDFTLNISTRRYLKRKDVASPKIMQASADSLVSQLIDSRRERQGRLFLGEIFRESLDTG